MAWRMASSGAVEESGPAKAVPRPRWRRGKPGLLSARPVFANERCGPGGVWGWKRRLGVVVVINAQRVPAAIVDGVNQLVEVDTDRFGGAEWDGDFGERLAEAYDVDVGPGPAIAAGDDDAVVARWGCVWWVVTHVEREWVAATQEVNFDEVGARSESAEALLFVGAAPSARP